MESAGDQSATTTGALQLGVFPSASTGDGGIFQYSLSLLDGLVPLIAAGAIAHPLLFHPRQSDLPLEELRQAGFRTVEFPFRSRRDRVLDPLRRLAGDGPARRAWRRLRLREAAAPPPGEASIRRRPELARALRELGIDLMIYPFPNGLAFEIGVPYVMTIHDMQHRLQPRFPEVSADGEWEWREYVFRNGAREATLLLVDSETSRDDVVDAYGENGVTVEAIEVLPVMPAPYLEAGATATDRQRVREGYRLPPRYFFYPAQFWPHKNHLAIIEAVALLRDTGEDVDVVLAGTWSGSVREETHGNMVERAQELGIAGRIHVLGYVPNKDLPALLAESVALVMPTFFGPTNIPPLEAWLLDVPVITSDLRGIREHMGDAAVLVDPTNPGALADGMRRIWTDAELRASLVERARVRRTIYTTEAHRERVARIVESARRRLQQA